MSTISKYKNHIFGAIGILAMVVVIYYVGMVLLPFGIALVLAYILNPTVNRIRKVIPNRNLAVTLLLVVILGAMVGGVVGLGELIVQDVKRLNGAFITFSEEHQEDIDETLNSVKEYISGIYESEQFQNQIETAVDSLENSDNLIEELKQAASSLTAFVGSGSSGEEAAPSGRIHLSWWTIIIHTMIYFVYIIYTYGYFERKLLKYFNPESKLNVGLTRVLTDFKSTFLVYFKQRTKIVVICMAIFITSFWIMGVPGALVMGVIAGLLCYVPHFHYLALIPLSLGCWVLSIETGHSFFLYIGILAGICLVVSVLDEMVLFPNIMKGVSSMNPAIMMLSFFLWTYVFGGFFGTMIALPLTSLILIYLDRILMYSQKHSTILGTGKKEA